MKPLSATCVDFALTTYVGLDDIDLLNSRLMSLLLLKTVWSGEVSAAVGGCTVLTKMLEVGAGTAADSLFK